jgi:hypothetical protein
MPWKDKRVTLSRSSRHCYEVIMLNYTFIRLMTFKPATAENELDRNTLLESFGVHAWNLIEFLSKKVRKNDQNASDYLPSFEPPERKPHRAGSRSKSLA